jgi:hypothetical protein
MTSRNAARGATLVLLAALLHPGCTFLRRGEEPVYEPAPISVVVDNRNWSQVVVYAEIRGMRRRLGEVNSASSSELEIPELFSQRTDLRLVVTPLASSESYRTGVIVVAPGATVQLTVENNLRLSSWSLRR